jgi:hypothetical protein
MHATAAFVAIFAAIFVAIFLPLIAFESKAEQDKARDSTSDGFLKGLAVTLPSILLPSKSALVVS